MSFGFQFDDEELDEEYRDAVKDSEDETLGRDATSSEPAVETISSKASKHTLEELLSALPSRISYSSLKVPLKELQKTLYRRDLFDARFQLINDDQEDDSEGSKGRFSAGAQTDLVPGVYEGGFKTWECAIDLVAHLEECISQEGDVSLLCDAKVTELGCGTALPSMYLFSRMLSAKEETIDSSFALCDFNEQVLRLVSVLTVFDVEEAKLIISSCRSHCPI
jgi:protein-histidine N-methyltransferase